VGAEEIMMETRPFQTSIVPPHAMMTTVILYCRKIKKHDMERLDVYKVIDGERDYQNTVRAALDGVADNDKSPEAFLLFIEYHLNKAKVSAYELNTEEVQSQVRKIAALCVASMEAFGAKSRETS
jgi:hypothetical protein